MPERQPSNDPEQWHSAMEQGCASDRSHIPSTHYLAHVRRNDDGSFEIHESGDRALKRVLTRPGNIDRKNKRIKVGA